MKMKSTLPGSWQNGAEFHAGQLESFNHQLALS